MISAVYRTPKLYDGQLYSLVRDLLEIDSEGFATISYALMEQEKFNGESDFSSLTESKDRMIESLRFEFSEGVQDIVGFHRGVVPEEKWTQQPNKSGFNQTTPNAHFDEIGLLAPPRQSYNSQNPAPKQLDRETVFSVTRLISKFAVKSTFVGQDAASTTLADIVVGEISELKKLHLEMTRGLADAQKVADKLNAKRRADLEDEANERRKLLLLQEEEIENRRKELNDREPQHERRRLREHLTDRLQKTISEPNEKSQLNERQSHYFYLGVGLVFVVVSVALTFQTLDVSATASFWAKVAKSTAAGVAGAAFIWAGLSGLKASATAQRQYEQEIQRYAFDMDRASWIVETILQMNAIEKASIPEEWLSSVCRNLFGRGETEGSETNSLEALAALLDATAKARIGTNGVEFEIDKKGAKKIASQVE